MATLLRNVLSNSPECGIGNKAEIENRTSNEIDAGIFNTMRIQISDMSIAIGASPDQRIRTIKKATSFPVADVIALLEASAGCKYLRIYNGFDENGIFVTYMAPINPDFQSYLKSDLSDSSKVSKSCCHCNPCDGDSLLGV